MRWRDRWASIWFLAIGIQVAPVICLILFQVPSLQTVFAAQIASVLAGPFNLLLVAYLATVCFCGKADGEHRAQWLTVAPVMLAFYVAVGELFMAVRLATGLWNPLTWSILRASISIGVMLASAYATKVFVWRKNIAWGSVKMWHLLGFIAGFGVLLVCAQPLHKFLVRLFGLGGVEGTEAIFHAGHQVQAIYHGLNCGIMVLAALVMLFLILRNAGFQQRIVGLAALGAWIVSAIYTVHFGFSVMRFRYGSYGWAAFAALLAGVLSVLYARHVAVILRGIQDTDAQVREQA
jgi:hypothetical protein